jgi:hypothetical protein
VSCCLRRYKRHDLRNQVEASIGCFPKAPSRAIDILCHNQCDPLLPFSCSFFRRETSATVKLRISVRFRIDPVAPCIQKASWPVFFRHGRKRQSTPRILRNSGPYAWARSCYGSIFPDVESVRQLLCPTLPWRIQLRATFFRIRLEKPHAETGFVTDGPRLVIETHEQRL